MTCDFCFVPARVIAELHKNTDIFFIFKVHEIHHYWKWLNETFIPSLMPQLYYDNLTAYDKGFVADVPTAWVLSVARLRQLRIKKGTVLFWFRTFFLLEEDRRLA